jgi:transposase IS66 family protein
MPARSKISSIWFGRHRRGVAPPWLRTFYIIAIRTETACRASRVRQGSSYGPRCARLLLPLGVFASGKPGALTLKKVPIAIEAVRRIDVLFAIEREINGLVPQARLAVRQERSRPLITDLEAWLCTECAKLSSKTPVAKAIQYRLRRWAAMIRVLDDGRICLSNNAAERALRGIAVGRHNWTFAGSDRGGERAAAIYTLIETCKLNDVDPRRLARRCPGTLARSSREPRCRPGALELEAGEPGSYRGLTITTLPLGAHRLRALRLIADVMWESPEKSGPSAPH